MAYYIITDISKVISVLYQVQCINVASWWIKTLGDSMNIVIIRQLSIISASKILKIDMLLYV
jgi:hypothetical protein